jgi:hypothetical protein
MSPQPEGLFVEISSFPSVGWFPGIRRLQSMRARTDARWKRSTVKLSIPDVPPGMELTLMFLTCRSALFITHHRTQKLCEDKALAVSYGAEVLLDKMNLSLDLTPAILCRRTEPIRLEQSGRVRWLAEGRERQKLSSYDSGPQHDSIGTVSLGAVSFSGKSMGKSGPHKIAAGG